MLRLAALIRFKKLAEVRMRSFGMVLAFACCGAAWGGPQRADWLTDGGNPERTAWQKNEKILTTGNVNNMKLLWKIKLPNEPRQMHSLLPPLIIGRANTSSGPKEIAIETGVSDNIFAIDVGNGEILWKKHFESTWKPPATGGRG